MIDEREEFPFCKKCGYEEEENPILVEKWVGAMGVTEHPSGDHPICPKCGQAMVW